MKNSQPSAGKQKSEVPSSIANRAGRIILLLGWVVLGLWGFSVLTGPRMGNSREEARRAQSENNMAHIAFALITYETTHGELPPAVVTDASGKPLYSWRVLVLQELERADLYERFELSQSWDSPANRPLINMMPDVFRSPYGDIDGSAGLTPYQAVVDSTGTRTAMGRTKRRRLATVEDGLSNTALFLENRRQPVIWTKPDDTDPAELLAELSADGADADVTVGFCDFAIKRLQDDFLTMFPGAMYANDGKVPPR